MWKNVLSIHVITAFKQVHFKEVLNLLKRNVFYVFLLAVPKSGVTHTEGSSYLSTLPHKGNFRSYCFGAMGVS